MNIFKRKKKPEDKSTIEYKLKEELDEQIIINAKLENELRVYLDRIINDEEYYTEALDCARKERNKLQEEIFELQEYKRKYIQLISIKGLENLIKYKSYE